MKIKKTQRNLLKFHLLDKKIYKIFYSKKVCHLLKLKSIELQLKKIIKVFFKLMLKKKNSIFLTLLSISKKTHIIYLDLLHFFTNNKIFSINFIHKFLNYHFLQLLCSFFIFYMKKEKVSKMTVKLTNIIMTDNLKNLKKIKDFHCLNYFIFWNSANATIILKLFYFLILKLSKSASIKKISMRKVMKKNL